MNVLKILKIIPCLVAVLMLFPAAMALGSDRPAGPAEKAGPSGTKGVAAALDLGKARTARKDWTILVYMDSDNDLEGYGISDINEMEAGIGGIDLPQFVVPPSK